MRAIVASAAVALAVVLNAGAASAFRCQTEAQQDETFWHRLSSDGTLFSFNLEKMQAKRACESLAHGVAERDVRDDLMRDSGYSYDVAESIISSGLIAYCPQYLGFSYPIVPCPPTPTP